jgi:hypothetical protein
MANRRSTPPGRRALVGGGSGGARRMRPTKQKHTTRSEKHMSTKDLEPDALDSTSASSAAVADHPVRTDVALAWEGNGRGEIAMTDELTVTITLGGVPLFGIDVATGQLLCWPDGERAVLLARFTAPNDEADTDGHPQRSQSGVPVTPVADPDRDFSTLSSSPVITRAQVEEWTGQWISDDHLQRLSRALPHSSVPDAIATIVTNFQKHDDVLDAPIQERDRLGMIHEEIVMGRADEMPDIYRERAT